MPREQITRNLESDTFRRHLHIGWNKQGGYGGDGWVQFSTDVTVFELRSMLAIAEGEAAAEHAKIERMAEEARNVVGGAQLDTLPLAQFEEGFPFRVVGEVLNRSEVNRLVQLARKARDDAYGRDA